jgi:hypothetical protein
MGLFVLDVPRGNIYRAQGCFPDVVLVYALVTSQMASASAAFFFFRLTWGLT